ncbi:hypothetical protein T484DRAFT_3648433, partial [Baffinella frigidus]
MKKAAAKPRGRSCLQGPQARLNPGNAVAGVARGVGRHVRGDAHLSRQEGRSRQPTHRPPHPLGAVLRKGVSDGGGEAGWPQEPSPHAPGGRERNERSQDALTRRPAEPRRKLPRVSHYRLRDPNGDAASEVLGPIHADESPLLYPQHPPRPGTWTRHDSVRDAFPSGPVPLPRSSEPRICRGPSRRQGDGSKPGNVAGGRRCHFPDTGRDTPRRPTGVGFPPRQKTPLGPGHAQQ